MMQSIRRILTVAGTGQRTVHDDRTQAFGPFAPGVEVCELWHHTGERDAAAARSPEFPAAPLIPQPGQLAARVVQFQPFDLEAKQEENALLEQATGAATRNDLHATPTLEYYVVLSGRMHLLVETGEAELGAGDCLVLMGGYHSWENRSEAPAALFSVMFGALNAGDAARTGVVQADNPSHSGTRLVVAGVDQAGRSAILADGVCAAGSGLKTLWVTAKLPADNRFDGKVAAYGDSAPLPSCSAVMHRLSLESGAAQNMAPGDTGSWRIALIVEGQLQLATHAGTFDLQPDTVVVQTGDATRWQNDSNAPAHLVVIDVPAPTA